MKTILEFLGVSLGCIAVLFFLVVGGFWLYFNYPPESTVGKYDLGKGIEVKLFSEVYWETSGRGLYYRVKKDGREFVPQTLLWFHHDEDDEDDPVEMTSFQTGDGSLVGLHTTPTTSTDCEMFIILDLESGETWPRLRADESASDPAVMVKWRRRYSRLKAEIRDLPCSIYLETPKESLESTAPSAAPQL